MSVTDTYKLNLDAGLRDGFVIRCQSKLVTCYDEDGLAARPSSTLYDFLKRTSGTIPDCGSTVNRTGSATTLDEIEQMLGPTSVAGMEVYLSGQLAPMRYSNPANKSRLRRGGDLDDIPDWPVPLSCLPKDNGIYLFHY